MIDWCEVDGQLRTLAVRRAALDAEEARLLREAERLQIWRPLGMVSALDYMERVLGYTPHAAMERLRVARALESLPVLEAALDDGRLNFSAVRELTRVATPSTEAAWCASAIGKNVRQVEQLVAGHAPGDNPDDPADPALQRYKLTLDLSAEVYARWRQTQTTIADERGKRIDDEPLLIELMEGALDRGSEPTGRAKFQIMMTICKQCDRGWQQGGGRDILVDAATVERAKCDAQWIGSTDDPLPVRASQDIPPSIVRFVWARDGGRCTTPGCRSTVALEIHHGIPRSQGGSHHPDNLGLKSWGCHSSIHNGTLEIVDGSARRPNEPPRSAHVTTRVVDVVTSHVGRLAGPASGVEPAPTDIDEAPLSLASVVGPTAFDVAAMRAQARDALVGLGWKAVIARTAVEEAMSHVGRDAPIEALIREALRRCPRRTG